MISPTNLFRIGLPLLISTACVGDMSMDDAGSVKSARSALAELQHAAPGIFITLASPDSITEPLPKGRLTGMSIAVKDNIHVARMPNTAGTAAMQGFVPSRDAPVIARLRAEGALIVGKTNMHELAFGITSNNSYSGPVRNPHDLSRFAGGSSGGSAAAVASGITDAAIGTDTGGSMRIPAALCGIIGYRPSVGRYLSEGITPISFTRDVPGPMARDMQTITLLDSVMSGRPRISDPVRLEGLRLGVARKPFFENLDPQTAELAERALRKLQQAGVELIEADLEGLSKLASQASFPIVLFEVVDSLPRYLRQYGVGPDFFALAQGVQSPDVRGLFESLTQDADADGIPDGVIPQEAYEAAIHEFRPRMIALYQSYFSTHNVDALIFPTSILPASPIEDSVQTIKHNGQDVPVFATYIRNTDPGSTAGLPGLSLPIGKTDTGLPVALAIDVLPGKDEALLEMGLALASIF